MAESMIVSKAWLGQTTKIARVLQRIRGHRLKRSDHSSIGSGPNGTGRPRQAHETVLC